jgi:hypothetical protein
MSNPLRWVSLSVPARCVHRAQITLVLLLTLQPACDDRRAAPQRDAEMPTTAVSTLEEVHPLREADGVPLVVDAAGAALQGHARWILPDYATQKLVVLDSVGHAAFSFGGRGGAPGEFGSLDGAFMLGGDTLALFDRSGSVLKYFVNGKPAASSSRLDQWPWGSGFGLVLAGRFANGEWVALKRAPRLLQLTGARIVVDTPSLLAGEVASAPRPLLTLGPKFIVDVLGRGGSHRLSLDEVAPRVLVICERGLVVVDTNGVRYYDTNGKLLRRRAIPFARAAVSTRERAEILTRAVRGPPLDGPTLEAKSLLEKPLATVDSALNVPVIDASGSVWISPPKTTGPPTHYRLTADGEVNAFRFPKVTGLERAGFRTLLGRTYDIEAGDSYLSVFRLPDSVPAPPAIVGTCGRPIRY